MLHTALTLHTAPKRRCVLCVTSQPIPPQVDEMLVLLNESKTPKMQTIMTDKQQGALDRLMSYVCLTHRKLFYAFLRFLHKKQLWQKAAGVDKCNMGGAAFRTFHVHPRPWRVVNQAGKQLLPRRLLRCFKTILCPCSFHRRPQSARLQRYDVGTTNHNLAASSGE